MDAGGGKLVGGYTPTVNFNDGGLTVSGAGSEQATPEIPVDANGFVDLNALVGTLSKQTGISEEVIVKDFLPGIVQQIEAHGQFKMRGMELLKDMASDRMADYRPSAPAVSKNVTDGQTVSSKEVVKTFSTNGVYVNPSSTPNNPALTTSIQNDVNSLLNGSSNVQGFTAKLEAYMQQFPNGDVMASLFAVFKESIEQTNEDKRYFLTKLSEMNKLSEAMGGYLKELQCASQNLEADTVDDMKSKGKKYQAGSTTTEVTEKSFYTGGVDDKGNAISTTLPSKRMNNTALGCAIKKLETDMETVRNTRQEYQTMFENFDQKANQLFNILSTVLKSIKEMEGSITRNML